MAAVVVVVHAAEVVWRCGRHMSAVVILMVIVIVVVIAVVAFHAVQAETSSLNIPLIRDDWCHCSN